MRKIKQVLMALCLVMAFAFVGLTSFVKAADATMSDEAKVDYDLSAINVPTTAKMSFPVTTISAYGSTIEYSSYNLDVINTNFVKESGWVYVNRNAEQDLSAKLTITVSLNEVSKSKEITVTVPKGTTSTRTINVTFDVSSAEIDQVEAMSVKLGEHKALPTPTKQDYIFVGWFDNLEGTGRKYTTTLGLLNDVTLYPIFKAATVNSITVDATNVKKVYNAFETFDTEGLVVTGTKNNGGTVTLSPSDYKVVYNDGRSVLHASDTSVEIVYNDNSEIKATVDGLTVNKLTIDVKDEDFITKYTYDGEEHSVTLTADASTRLEKLVTVTYGDNNKLTNVGTQDVTVNFKLIDEVNYNSIDAKTLTLEVEKLTIDLTGIVNPDVNNAVYDGEEHMLTLKIDTTSFEKFKDALDYQVTLQEGSNGIDAKVHNFNITYSSKNENIEFINGISDATFEITSRKFDAEFSVSDIADIIVSKRSGFEKQTPDFEVLWNTKELVKDTDYTVEYENVTEIETGKFERTVTITIKGTGNFMGQLTKKFTVVLADNVRVQEDSETLKANSTINVTVGTELLTTLPNGSRVEYTPSSTVVKLEEVDGVLKVTAIVQQAVEQQIKVLVMVAINDTYEYVELIFVIPAQAKSFTDEATGVVLENVPQEVTDVTVQKVEDATLATYTVTEGFKAILGYDITLNGLNTSSSLSVLVRIPLEGVTSTDNIKVYHVSSDGTLKEVDATLASDGTYVEFTATSFSAYVVAKEEKDVIQTKTVEEILALSKGDEYYQITGIVKNIVNTTYGNFDLVDINNPSISIFVYGLLTEKDGDAKKFSTLNISEGDILVLVGKRAEYDNTAQIGSAYYVSHRKNTVNVTVNVTPESTGIASVDQNVVKNGTTVTLTVTPNEGYKLSKILVNGEQTTLTNNQLVVVFDTVIEVIFVEEGTTNWTLLTNVADLKDGEEIIIAASKDSKTYYAGNMNGKFLNAVTSIDDAIKFTVNIVEDGKYTLTYNGNKLGTTAAKNVVWDSGTTTWTITIESGNATITSTNNSSGRILCNVGGSRFIPYTSATNASMLLPQIYVLR